LALAEVRQEIERILRNPADVARLRKLAAPIARGARLLDTNDLLQEVVTQLLSGERKWPRGVDAVPLLVMNMRSVASNSRKKRDYRLAADLVPPGEDDQSADYALDRLGPQSTNLVTPERELEGVSEIHAVQALVLGDENLELLIEAMADGLKGQAAMEALGWDTKTYDATRKRLHRRLNTATTRSDR